MRLGGSLVGLYRWPQKICQLGVDVLQNLDGKLEAVLDTLFVAVPHSHVHLGWGTSQISQVALGRLC